MRFSFASIISLLSLLAAAVTAQDLTSTVTMTNINYKTVFEIVTITASTTSCSTTVNTEQSTIITSSSAEQVLSPATSTTFTTVSPSSSVSPSSTETTVPLTTSSETVNGYTSTSVIATSSVNYRPWNSTILTFASATTSVPLPIRNATANATYTATGTHFPTFTGGASSAKSRSVASLVVGAVAGAILLIV
ncbi:hypothetical protein V1509DRAFT_631125 [Lipomyces kononenkoae]